MPGWLSRALDRWQAANRATKRRWMIRGRSCGHETSMLRVSGFRTGPALKLAHCPTCGALQMVDIYRRPIRDET